MMNIKGKSLTTRTVAGLLLLSAGTVNLQAQQQVAVFSLNDFHGAFVRDDAKDIPGAPAIYETLDSLKQLYPCHVTVSAGDNFGGSYFYNATKGILLPVFFNDLGIQVSAVGNHEFDDGQRELAEKWEKSPLRPRDWDITYVCSNVRRTDTGAIPDYAQPVVSVPVQLPGGKMFRVAFAGLISSSTPRQVSVRRIAGLSFDGRYEAVLDSVMKLPEATLVRDANLRLLLVHNGTFMDRQGRPCWDDPDSIHLANIGGGLWHGILSAHTHKPVCGLINSSELPVVQGRWHGNYISMLLCTVDTTTLQVTAVEPHIVPVTPKEHLSAGPERLRLQIDSLLQHTVTKGGTPIGTVLCRMDKALPHSREDKYRQTEMGTLVCQAYAETFRRHAGLDDRSVVIGCSHAGSIRAGFAKGSVSVMDVGEALPFSNSLKVYQLTGKQLMELVRFGLRNQRYGYLQLGNLEPEKGADGKVESLVYISPEGFRKVLSPKGKYYLVADEFITQGGDGYSPDFFPKKQEVKVEGMPQTTDAFIQYLRAGTL